MHPNIELYLPKKAGVFADFRKLHHKLMVIDERILVAGSFNYTAPANEYNDENIFAMGSVHKEVEGSRSRPILVVSLKAEIERIIAVSELYVPT